MIRSLDDISIGLDALAAMDERLLPVIERAGALPLRAGDPGLPGLAATLMGQQVSRASATAITSRLAGMVDLNDAASILALDDTAFRTAGLSRAKERTLLAIASAVITGTLDFDRIAAADSRAAIAELTAVPGIGPWTAECYLLFCLGREDIFPAGDLALQVAVAHAFGMEERPGDRPLRAMAELWSPHRSVAARLFWAYYAAVTRRDATPAALQQDAKSL